MSDKPLLGDRNDDVLDHLLYPVYMRLAVRIPRWVTPNTLTWAGCASATAAAALVAFGPGRQALLAAGLLVALKALLDGLDGIHARRTGQTSDLGAFLDWSLDGLVLTLLLLALLARFDLWGPFFGTIVLFRMYASVLNFVYWNVWRDYYLPPVGPTTEDGLIAAGLVLNGLFPGALDVGALVPPGAMRDWLVAAGLGHLHFMPAVMLVYAFALPATLVNYFVLAFRKARTPAPAAPPEAPGA